jgi:L-asparaginase / beta-aspartyl-peptidase
MGAYAIVVHGGCGRWPAGTSAAALRGVRAAVQAARDILENGGDALDAACAAVVALENDPLFNAGTGAVLNAHGEAELDACVMTGRDLRCGAVAALRNVRNPILVARAVMERTPHILLAGNGALRFARGQGFKAYDPVTPERMRQFKARRLGKGPPGTVGAVVLDTKGRIAAATSTGGMSGKLPGRVGDSPIAGAGNYATRFAGASATGRGELMLRSLCTKTLCDLVEAGKSAPAAARTALKKLPEPGEAGVICIDASGRIGIAAPGRAMPHAWVTETEGRIHARMRVQKP